MRQSLRNLPPTVRCPISRCECDWETCRRNGCAKQDAAEYNKRLLQRTIEAQNQELACMKIERDRVAKKISESKKEKKNG